MDRILDDAKGIGAIVEDLVKNFNKGDLDRIRRGLPYTDQMINDFLRQVVITARNMFGNHPRVMKLPSMRELPNTFIFRTALCAHLLARRWISVGGPHKTGTTKIRNDIIDVNFAVFATYFDGLLSDDGNANDIYTKSNFILREIILPSA